MIAGRPVGAAALGPPAERQLDLLMADAWPAAEVETHEGWRFRWSEGVTRRACSVLPVGADDHMAALVEAAEGFYAHRGAPARVQVSTASAPPALTPFLDARGYTRE